MNTKHLLNEDHFILSTEVILLLEWLLEYEQETLKDLVATSLRHGFSEHLERIINSKKKKPHEHMQQHIVDFFSLIDQLIAETREEEQSDATMQRLMLPAINHVDAQQYDANTLQESISKATKAFGQYPGEAKSIFYKELLKRWQPLNKKTSNAN